MGQRDLLKKLSKLLSEYQISYLLTGSLAVSYYGIPRATHDIDFVLEIKEGDSQKIIRAIKSLNNSYLVDEYQIREAVSNSSQFNIYHPETGIKIDFWITGKSEFEKNKFKRGKRILFEKQKIDLISPEDLILTKLLWCRKIMSEKHIHDCVGIFKIQTNKLDTKYLHRWAKKLKVETLLQEASSQVDA